MKIFAALSLKAKIIAGALTAVAVAGTAAVVIVLSSMPEAFRLLKIFEMTGTSVVTRADAGEIDAYTGMNLESGDIIEVGEKSTMTLSLDSNKYLSLDPSTVLELIAEGTETDSKTTVNLKSGGVLNEITEPLSAESSYSVNTPKATMAVRGTSFYVSVQKLDDGSYITDISVFHGKVEIQLIDEEGNPRGEPVIVQPNESVAILTVPSEGSISGAEINGTSCFIIRKSDGSDTFAIVEEGESPIMPLNLNIIPDRVIDRVINTHDNTDIVLSEEVLHRLLGDDTYSANIETTSQIRADETTAATTVSEINSETSAETTVSEITTTVSEIISETASETTVPQTTAATASETTVPVTEAEATVVPSETTTVPETTSATTVVSKKKKAAVTTTVPETNSEEKKTTSKTTVTEKTEAVTTVPTSPPSTGILNYASGTTTPSTFSATEATTTTEAEPVSYTVNFISNPGGITVAAPQTVEEGGYAEEPSEYSSYIYIDDVEYTFMGFESSFGPITADTDISVKYAKSTAVFSVYVTDNGTTTLVGEYDEGASFTLPQPAGKDGATFKYWGHSGVTSGGALRERGQYQPGDSMTANHSNAYEFESNTDTEIKFEAVYEDKTPVTLTFVYNGTTYDTVTGYYVGDSYPVPSFPYDQFGISSTTHIFSGYSGSDGNTYTIGDFITLTGDITFTANVTENQTTPTEPDETITPSG